MEVVEFVQTNALFITVVSIWTVPWKGVALWRAARRGDTWWFIILLVVNTLAILEIIYIFAVSRRPKQDAAAPSKPAAKPTAPSAPKTVKKPS